MRSQVLGLVLNLRGVSDAFMWHWAELYLGWNGSLKASGVIDEVSFGILIGNLKLIGLVIGVLNRLLVVVNSLLTCVFLGTLAKCKVTPRQFQFRLADSL